MITKLIEFLLAIFIARPGALAPEVEKEVFNYVDFGSSQTLGYGLKGFIPMELYDEPTYIYGPVVGGARDGYYSSGHNYYPDNGYPMLIKAALQEQYGPSVDVRLQQCAMNSMRAYDLDFILTGNKPADTYIEWRLGDGSPNSGWMYDINRARNDTITINGVDYHYQKEETNLREDIINYVTDADFISYDLGVNDFGVYLACMIAADEFDNNLYNVMPEYAGTYYEVQKTVGDLLLKYLPDYVSADTLQQINFLADTFAYAFIGFITSFDNAIGKIYELNPDVEIVVVQIQNFLSGIKLNMDGIEIPLGDVFGVVMGMANAYTAYLSPYADKYYFADFAGSDRVDYFLDELRNWDGTVTSLLGMTDIIDCLNCYQDGMLVETMVKDYVYQLGCDQLIQIDPSYSSYLEGVTSYNQLIQALTPYLPDFVDNLKALKESACEITYYSIVKAFNYVSNVNTISFASTNTEEILGNIFDTSKAGIISLVNGTSMDDVLANVDTAIASLLADQDDKETFFGFMYLEYANCYFTHPNADGHLELKRRVLKAFNEKQNKRIRDGILLVDGVVEDINEGIDNALALIGSKFQEITAKAEEIVNSTIEDIKNRIGSYEDLSLYLKQKIAEFKDDIKEAKEIFIAAANQAIDEFKEDVEAIKKDVLDFIDKVETTFDEILNTLVNIDELVETIKDASEKIKNGVNTALTYAYEIGKAIETRVKKIEQAISSISSDVVRISKSAAKLADKIEAFEEKINNLSDRPWEIVSIDVLEFINEAKDVIDTAFDFSDELVEVIDNTVDTLYDLEKYFVNDYLIYSAIFRSGADKLFDSIRNICVELKQYRDELEEKVEQEVKQLIEKAKEFIEEKAEEGKKVVKEIIVKAGAAYIQEIEQIIIFLNQYKEQVRDSIDNVVNNYFVNANEIFF